MVYFNESYLTIHWDELYQCVWMEWKAFAKGENFRTGLNKGLELVIQKKTSRWLADTRNLKVVAQDDQRWTNEDWFPRALAAGVRSMAIVTPKARWRRCRLETSCKTLPTRVLN